MDLVGFSFRLPLEEMFSLEGVAPLFITVLTFFMVPPLVDFLLPLVKTGLLLFSAMDERTFLTG